MTTNTYRPSRRRVLAALGLLGALALGACTPLTERTTLTRAGAAGSDRTGQSVDVSADGLTMAVGTPYAEVKQQPEAGLVTVYTRTDGDLAWTKTAEFGAKSAAEEAHFANSVSLSSDGNTMVVGAPGQSGKGVATVFTRVDGEWSEGTSLPSIGANNDRMGYAVAISNNSKVIAVGAPSQNVAVSNTPNAGSGRVWIYENVVGLWTLRSFVASSIPQVNQYFGSSVALSGDGSDIVIGAPQFDMYSDAKKAVQSNSGRVELFRRSGNAWAFSHHLKDDDTIRSEFFVGTSVAFSTDGTTIAVGAPGFDSTVTDIGAVIVYKKNNNGWDRVATMSSNTYVSARAGTAVSVSSNGEYVAVGAAGYATDKGGVVLLKRTATGYEATNSFFDTTAAGAAAQVGKSISISDDARVIAAGAPGTSNFAGAVKVVDRFTKPSEATDVKATAATGSALVSWTAPTDTGGLSLTYTVVSIPAGFTCTATGTSCIVSGLTNGTAYTFRVTAKNAAGSSQGSIPSAGVTPTAAATVAAAIGTVPGAPTDVKVVSGWKRATISWVVPASNGGQQIFSFKVTASPGGQSCTTFGAQACTITGLAAKKQHTFSVVATNALGDSAAATSEKVALQPKVGVRGGPTAVKLAGWQGLSSGKGGVVSMKLVGKAAKANCKIVDGKLIAKVPRAECKLRVKARGAKVEVRTINIYTVRR